MANNYQPEIALNNLITYSGMDLIVNGLDPKIGSTVLLKSKPEVEKLLNSVTNILFMISGSVTNSIGL